MNEIMIWGMARANELSVWLNGNQGVVSVVLFISAGIFGWVSGIFSAFRRKPKFKISLLPGPSFCCTFRTGKKEGCYDLHRTGIALYVRISNVGSAPSSIEGISIGYHWSLKPFSYKWVKYTIGWFWLNDQTMAIKDFQIFIGENIKFYPFLTQHSIISGKSPNNYLDIGKSTSGVVYFEQPDSWGGCFPAHKKGIARMKISILDVFGGKHLQKFDVPVVSLEAARKYNPSFGNTFAEQRGEILPYDLDS